MGVLQEGFVSAKRSAPWRGTGRSIHALSLILAHEAVGGERV